MKPFEIPKNLKFKKRFCMRCNNIFQRETKSQRVCEKCKLPSGVLSINFLKKKKKNK